MFCYQRNYNSLSAARCSRETFWKAIKDLSTKWKVDARRAIIEAVDRSKGEEGHMALTTWLNNNDYQRFLVAYPETLSDTAKENFAKKSDAEKLLIFADDLKHRLTPFVFSCYEFDAVGKKHPRKLKGCHLNGLVMLDLDHLDDPMPVWYRLRDNQKLMARVVFVHVTSSGYGIRIIFTADIEQGNLADNQIVMARALGCKPDSSCIDATRNSFCPKEEDILFIDEERLFDYYDEDFDKRFTNDYREKRTQPLFHKFDTDDSEATDSTPGSAPSAKSLISASDLSIKWRGHDLQGIIDARYAAKLPCAEDSNRHKESLKLATDLLLMLDGDRMLVLKIVQAQPWVQEIIKERDENVEQTVASAVDCVAEKERKFENPQPSKEMRAAIKAVTGKAYKEFVSSTTGFSKEEGNMDAQLEAWGEEIETLFPHFPLLKDVCAGLKRSEYPVALFVAGGIGMTLMTRCWYRFYHRPQQERRLNCALIVIGHPGSNKSMADDIFSLLSSPIAAADKAGKNALNRYKRDRNKRATNKEGEDKPEGIIRLHPARTSNGQLIQDMLNAREMIEGKEIQLHMVTFDTELDNSITLQQGGSWINKQSMELKAFHNEKDGQMYQNSDSPVDEFHVTWNFIYTGTPIALKKKVTPQNFGSGLSTRLAVIPMPKTNFKMIAFEDVSAIDWQRLDRMKSWAYKLDSRFGELPLWDLVKHLYDWTANRMADCAEDDSEANELMLKRVPYHALNYSAPFIDMRHWDQLHLDGNYWTGKYETDEIDWKLCELIARIQYATQQHFFGVMAEKYFDDMNNDVQITGKRHYQKSVNGYNQLPEVFTKEDVVKCFGYSNKNGASVKIQRLIDQHLIVDIQEGEDKGKYKKINQML